MEQFNNGEWHCGRIPGTIVSNTVSGDMPRSADQVRHWGGFLIAEGIAPSNLTVLAFSKEMYRLLKIISAPEVGDIEKAMAEGEAFSLVKKIGGQ